MDPSTGARHVPPPVDEWRQHKNFTIQKYIQYPRVPQMLNNTRHNLRIPRLIKSKRNFGVRVSYVTYRSAEAATFSSIMLLKCIRLKRIYVKLAFVLLAVLFLLVLYVKLVPEVNSVVYPGVYKHGKLVSNLSNVFEQKLRDYESKIIANLGDDGDPAYLTGDDAKKGDESLKTFALNTVLSDRMPLDRKLRDPRNKKQVEPSFLFIFISFSIFKITIIYTCINKRHHLCFDVNVTSHTCKKFKYDPKLNTSVIVIFYNELLSVILRTIWSVILQTPSHLLQEIILVDDASTEGSLKGLLDYYVSTRLKDHNIRLVRLKSRMGLIRARLQGARVAQGDVLIFLDAHCEATMGWAEPLLSRIEEDRTAVLVPIIDVIEATNLAYSTNGDSSFQVGGFSWSGHFTWIDIQDEKDKNKLTPVKSPTMAGGLFAIDRNFFWDIGSYDEQMDGWGGENLEMSFRIWQCGGRLETVPCSRVGHIFRDFHPYSFPDNKDTHGINTARLAHVWMDDYKRFFFMYQPGLEDNPIVGDLTHRKQLRQKLRCKSFRWYLDNVYPEKFVLDEHVQAYGQARTEFDMCLDDLQLAEDKVGPLGLYQCHPYLAMSQYFSVSAGGELRKENFCAEVFGAGDVQLTECHGRRREQYWVLYRNGTVYSPAAGRCLSGEGVENGKGLKVRDCKNSVHQRWKFDHVNATAVLV
ncbi:hypothetical protein NQ318_015059 [Aromia moschata]|uniref:Polypeptide N-acetylgalactosaminyltransferase n=1 Tax=Aromia moschata TaxID=1265417 RepID=A0AAV8YZI8_9CUCU|nr:hypothetical protein NQ318_015059 [Aromia moschata]